MSNPVSSAYFWVGIFLGFTHVTHRNSATNQRKSFEKNTYVYVYVNPKKLKCIGSEKKIIPKRTLRWVRDITNRLWISIMSDASDLESPYAQKIQILMFYCCARIRPSQGSVLDTFISRWDDRYQCGWGLASRSHAFEKTCWFKLSHVSGVNGGCNWCMATLRREHPLVNTSGWKWSLMCTFGTIS